MDELKPIYQVEERNGRRQLVQMNIPIGEEVPEGWTEDERTLDYDGKVNEQIETNATLSKQLADMKIADMMKTKQLADLTMQVAELKAGAQ